MMNDRDSSNMKNEMDEFDANKVKTENEELKEQCLENDDVFDEALERRIKIDLSGQSLSGTVKYLVNDDVCYGCEQSGCKLDLKNKSTLTCLYEEETDDVFDEKQETEVKACVVDFNFTTGIKLEVDENGDTLYENVDFLTNSIKQENDDKQGLDRLLTSNIIIDNESYEEVEQKIKIEPDIEQDRTRIDKYDSYEDSKENRQNSDIQLEIEENAAKGNCVINTNNNFEINQQLDVEGRKKEKVPKTVMEKVIYVRDASQKLDGKGNRIKLREQSKDVNAVIFNRNIDEDRLKKVIEYNNLNEECITTNREQLNIGNEQRKESAKKIEMGNSLEVSTKILNTNATSREKNFNNILDLSPKIVSQRTDTLKEHTESDETKLGTRRNGRQLTEKKMPQNAENIIGFEENCEESVTEIKQHETRSKTKNQDRYKISLDINKPMKTDKLEECTKNADQFLKNNRKHKRKRHLLKHGISNLMKPDKLLEVCAKNVNNQFIRKIKKRERKRHLLKHGPKNVKFSNQCERIYSEKEPQAEVVLRNNQTEKQGVCSEESDKGIISNDTQFIGELNSRSMGEERCINTSDITLELPALQALAQFTNKNNRNNVLISEEGSQLLYEETKTVYQNKAVSLTDPKENVEKSIEKVQNDVPLKFDVSFNTTHSIVTAVVEKPDPETMSSNNIEYCCTECPFKAKRRAKFKIHLIQHGPNFSSGIISFLDLVQNRTLSTNQSGIRNKHANISENVEDTKERCTTDIHDIRSEEKKSGNADGSNKSLQSGENDRLVERDDNNQQSEIPNVENNTIREQTEPIMLSKEKNMSLPINKNKETFPTENLENSESQITEYEQVQKEEWAINKNEETVNGESFLITITNNDAISEESEKQITQNEQIQKEEEGIFPCDKNDANINVDTKSENVENLKTERNHLQILIPNDIKLESGSPLKRKTVRRGSSAPKKIKLEIKNDKIYCCDQCSYQSHSRKYLKSHIVIHSNNVIKCSLCDFITNLQRNMKYHMLVHLKPEEIKMHKCPHCPYQTKRRSDLQGHLVLHKKPEERQMFQCDKCPYQSKRQSNLRVHQLGHKSVDDGPLLSCAVCSFTTKKKCSLKSHMIVHQKVEETRWYKCEQCSYTTKYKSGLNRHSLVHKNRDEIKTYDCTVCSYRAKHKSHLKSHMLIHKDPKEVMIYNCDYCSYKAIQKCNLLTHMLKHKNIEEIKMTKCAHCPYKTKLKRNLLKHINRVHKLKVN